MSDPTLFSQISSRIIVDVDSMDPSDAACFSSIYQFCDMTSNQAIVYNEASRSDRMDVLSKAIQHVTQEGIPADVHQATQYITDVLNISLAKEVYPYLKGRVHVQVSPSAAYNTERTVEHAKRLVALFEENGIPKHRVCVKIPATPESMVACQRLESDGIRTLATCLFSIEQAVAASQAGCLYVAPYFNELRVHFEPSVWTEYKDTARDHPMSSVISSIIQVFRKMGSQTLVMPASTVTPEEVVSLVSLGPDHVTLSGTVLKQLRDLPPQSGRLDPDSQGISPAAQDEIGPSTDNDFLAAGGSLLKQALDADLEASRKLEDALKIFSEMEFKTHQMIEKRLNA